MKRAKRKPLIQFEYNDGLFEGGIYDPPLKSFPDDKIYFKMIVNNKVDVFKMTTDEAATMIACLGIALNQAMHPERTKSKTRS